MPGLNTMNDMEAPNAPVQTELTLQSIYLQECDYLWRTLRRFGVPARHVEDVAHDVFVVVHARLAEFDRKRPLRPWLIGIAFRESANFLRKGTQSRELLEELDAEDDGASPEDLAIGREARTLVARALATLEPDRRAVFVLHDLNGESVPDIAEALEIPLNTAYSRLRLARQEFTLAVRRMHGKAAR